MSSGLRNLETKENQFRAYCSSTGPLYSSAQMLKGDTVKDFNVTGCRFFTTMSVLQAQKYFPLVNINKKEHV
jgi:hypothetical protein